MSAGAGTRVAAVARAGASAADRVAADDEGGGLRKVGGSELVFVPGDPPRRGRFAAYSPAGDADFTGQIELVLPAGGGVRRRTVPALEIPLADALTWLTGLGPAERSVPGGSGSSVAAWADVVTAGLGVLARGRLFPTVSPAGFDAWRAGPLDPDDVRLLESVAAGLGPAAHCLPAGPGYPLRVMSPGYAVRSLWDALADTLVRTAAAPAVAGSELFTGSEPRDAAPLAGWLADTGARPAGSAQVGLRIVLDAAAAGDGDDGHPARVEAGPDAGSAAVVQLTSTSDPSLVVDGAELFSASPAVLARLGTDAESDLLLALRRGSRAWAPLGALLAQRLPAALALSDDDVEDLLGPGGEALRTAGIEVLWPSSLLLDGLALHAAVQAPKDGSDGTFSLEELVRFDWRLTLAGERLSPEEIQQLAEAKRSVVRLRGRWVQVDPALLDRARRRRERRMTAIEALAAVLAGEIEVDGTAVPVEAEGSVAALAERLRRTADGGPDALGPPPGLAGELRPYQQRGVAWLHQMCELGLGGCLADDMGLGKTVQLIGLQLHRVAAAEEGDRGGGRRDGRGRGRGRLRTEPAGAPATALIVCPTSLIGNWARELGRFAPELPVRRFHGPERSLDHLRPGEVVITTYGVVRRDRDALADAGFSLVVADEAQHAKNPLSDTARALRAVGGRQRVALTGTPVENRLTELWSVLDWTTPGLLGPLERFRKTVAIPVEKRRDPEVTGRLTRTVRPFLLRRKKSDPTIAPELPARTVTDLPVALTAEQVTLYEAEVREALDAIRRKSGIARQGLVFRLLSALKQICNHPAQYLHQPGPIPGRSGKLAALEELLGVILDEGESVLVFSQYVELCALLEARLADLGVGTALLHGGVPARRRDELVAEFQAGRFPVFLLSLKAGGVGLNLTRATHVVHYDRWWNPAVEDQATDRAHRIGQHRAVQVHRLIAEGTLEDRIAELLEKKRDLAETVVGEGEAWIAQLSDDQLADLVSLGAGS